VFTLLIQTEILALCYVNDITVAADVYNR